ncbi:hypothetical protein ACUSIJ_18030 [Pseudochelatococcus sp. B33]
MANPKNEWPAMTRVYGGKSDGMSLEDMFERYVWIAKAANVLDTAEGEVLPDADRKKAYLPDWMTISVGKTTTAATKSKT